jgi:hypothetical protein
MTVHELQALETEPVEISSPLRALWCDSRGLWEAAHKMVQDDSSKEAAWVHAYLHRKEGELENARYWYHRAGQPPFDGSLTEEWRHVAAGLL